MSVVFHLTSGETIRTEDSAAAIEAALMSANVPTYLQFEKGPLMLVNMANVACVERSDDAPEAVKVPEAGAE